MSTYADASDVATRWGKDPATLDTAVTNLINVRLGDVERMLKRRIPDLEQQVTSGDLDVEDVKQVEAEAVLRLARNPEGYLSESDGNYTYMLMQEISSGKLEILPDEWAILGISSTGMFVIGPNAVRAT